MSAEAAVAVRSWSVGPYRCELTVQRPKPGAVVHAMCEWSPTEPPRLTTDEWREYTAGRNQALGEIASVLGITVGVLDV